MNKLYNLTTIGLLLSFLVACQKDSIEPTGAFTATGNQISAAKKSVCDTYSFFSKTLDGTTQTITVGQAQGSFILINFADDVTAVTQNALLSTYPEFVSIRGYATTEAGPIAVVELEAATTCADLNKLMPTLEKHNEIQGVSPTFGTPTLWQGFTNVFEVTFQGSTQNFTELSKLIKKTKTHLLPIPEYGGVYFANKIIPGFEDVYYCILLADKNSKGDALDMTTLFNNQPYVLEASPKFIYQVPSDDEELPEL